MIVVSDTSPLTALLTIAHADLLRRLFGEVIIPTSVQAELLRTHPALPDWLRVQAPKDGEKASLYAQSVDRGEAEAIALAEELHADHLGFELGYFLRDIAYGENRFVVVGQHGVIFSSADGVTWTSSPVGFEYDLLGATYAHGQFMVVGGGLSIGSSPPQGVILTSTNGLTWSRYPLQRNVLRAIAFGNSRFVAVGDYATILSLEPIAVRLPIRMGGVQVLLDGSVQGVVSGNAGQNYLIQASTNLTDWSPLTVLAASTNKTVQFTDPSAANFSRRFYRAVSP